MNLALVGSDPICLSLVRAVSASRQDALMLAAQPGADEARLRSSFPQVSVAAGWEALLGRTDLEAVILAADALDEWQKCRTLAQSGLHLLLSPGEAMPLEAYYELAMMAEETDVVFFPLLPARLHPAVIQLRQLLVAGALGPLRHVTLERQMPANDSAGMSAVTGHAAPPVDAPAHAATASRAAPSPVAMLRRFRLDADVLRCLAGELVEVSALASAVDESGVGGQGSEGQAVRSARALGVQMTTAGGVLVTWTQLCGTGRRRVCLRVVGEGGSACAEWGAPENAARLTWKSRDGGSGERDYGRWDSGGVLLAAFRAQATAKASKPEPTQTPPPTAGAPAPSGLRATGAAGLPGEAPAPTPSLRWVDAVRAAELADAAGRSLSRRRVIRLEHQLPSEEETFKGTMTALGCGLLGVVLALLLLGAAGTAFGLTWLTYSWYGVPLLLVAFLLLQALRLMVPSQRGAGEEDRATAAGPVVSPRTIREHRRKDE